MSDDATNLTLRQRRRLQRSEAVASGKPKSKRRLRWMLLSLGLICLLGVGVWAWLHFNRGIDPRLQEILALQSKVDQLQNPIGDDARALQRQIWEKAKDLPDDLKGQVRQKMRNSFDMRFDRFFQMSSKEQLALLDSLIAGFQAMEAVQKVKDALGGSSQSNANSGGGPKGWGGSDAQRMQHMEQMLSNLPPERRAQWTLGRQMFNARMQQQGATPPPGGVF